MTTAVLAVCRGCGAELPPQSWTGRRREWCSERCRKAQYGGACVDCGAATNGHDGRAGAPKRCRPCEIDRTTIPTDKLIAAIRLWAGEHGGVPPTEMDWNPAHAGTTAAQRAEYATGRWPSHTTIAKRFGSWNAGLIAAGFQPHRIVRRDPAVLEEWRQAVRDGEPVPSIAARWGITPNAIYLRLRTHGTPASTLRRKAAA